MTQNIYRDISLLSQKQQEITKLFFTIYVHKNDDAFADTKKTPGLLLSIIVTKMTAWTSCCYSLLPFPLRSKNFSMHFLVIDALEQYKEISYQFPITELERMTDIYPQMATPEDFFCTISSVIHIMIKSNSISNSFSLTFLFFCSLPFLSVFCHQ